MLEGNIPLQQERKDDHWKEIAERWKWIQKRKNEIEQEEKDCRNMLISSSENRTTTGFGVRVTQYEKKGRIAYNKIPEIKNVDLEQYRESTVEAWRITITS